MIPAPVWQLGELLGIGVLFAAGYASAAEAMLTASPLWALKRGIPMLSLGFAVLAFLAVALW